MLPLIGITVGFYVILRCLSFFSRSGERAESVLVKVFSVITILVTLVVIISLLGSGTHVPSPR